MHKFYVYSTKTDSFIVPQSKFRCKDPIHKWSLEGEFEICNKRIKLPRYISKMEEIDKIISHLIEEVPNEETK